MSLNHFLTSALQHSDTYQSAFSVLYYNNGRKAQLERDEKRDFE